MRFSIPGWRVLALCVSAGALCVLASCQALTPEQRAAYVQRLDQADAVIAAERAQVASLAGVVEQLRSRQADLESRGDAAGAEAARKSAEKVAEAAHAAENAAAVAAQVVAAARTSVDEAGNVNVGPAANAAGGALISSGNPVAIGIGAALLVAGAVAGGVAAAKVKNAQAAGTEETIAKLAAGKSASDDLASSLGTALSSLADAVNKAKEVPEAAAAIGAAMKSAHPDAVSVVEAGRLYDGTVVGK